MTNITVTCPCTDQISGSGNLSIFQIDSLYSLAWDCVKFDLSVIPANAVIVSATLKLTCSSLYGPTYGQVAAYNKVTSFWSESTPNYITSTYINSFSPSVGVKSLNVTTDIQNTVAQHLPHYGYKIISNRDYADRQWGQMFRGRTYATTSERPNLSVVYYIPTIYTVDFKGYFNIKETPNTITFIGGTEYVDGPATTITWNWDFGDSSTYSSSTTNMVQHTYGEAGIYDVTLEAAGVDASFSKNDNITIGGVVPDFEVIGGYGTFPLKVGFHDTSLYMGKGFTHVVWDFGDGVVKTGVYVEHTYNVPGEYNMTMTVHVDKVGDFVKTKKACVSVIGQTHPVDVQLEFAHQSGVDKMRHVVLSKHDLNTASENRLMFLMWGTELQPEDVGNIEVAEFTGDYKFKTTNLFPFDQLVYNIGSETIRWNEIVTKDAKVVKTQSKILKLWSGNQ